MRSERFAALDRIVREATGRLFTGAVARVESGGVLQFERAYGVTRADDAARPVFCDTRFDLASLTKLFVSDAALALASQGRIDLDEPLASVVESWRGTDHASITPRMLLAHTSGMNSGADYRTLLDEDVERFALHRPLVARPGERVIYSDLGMIALGVVLARVTGRSLPALLARRFATRTLGFRPDARERAAIPATEDDAWRGRVQGTVHDEKAHLCNGVAGHAGLFGCAADVARLTESYLGALRGRASARLPHALAAAAVTEQAYDPVLRRGLGWALKTNDENSCGARFSPSTFGHTGFTGTCVWADPERDVQGVLLTNTVYFGRSDSRPLRAAFYDAVIEATQP
ncbi:MAG: beta-lactamase family protein [bacterium]|nr:beta-lactamase family protein [bacterium]